MAALLGGLAAGPRRRRRLRAAQAARHHHRRRPDRLADAHPLHHAGRSISTSARTTGLWSHLGTCGAIHRAPPIVRFDQRDDCTPSCPTLRIARRLRRRQDHAGCQRRTSVPPSTRSPGRAPVVAPEHVANSPPRTIVAPRACFRSRRRRKRTPRRIARAAARQWRRSPLIAWLLSPVPCLQARLTAASGASRIWRGAGGQW